MADQKNQSDDLSVRVAVRVRPLMGQEKINGEAIWVTVRDKTKEIVMGTDRAFTFDEVFGIGSAQETVFTSCVCDLVEAAFSGYNATVLAYGQTGAGKTHTMGSGQRLSVPEEQLGIIPRVIQDIFSEVEERKSKSEFILKVSFLEIYNEEIHDLLEPKQTSITIREDKGTISLMGLHEQRVESYEEMASQLDKGSFNRSTASTLMNLTSSRSHAIFTISIEQHIVEDLVTGEKIDEDVQEYMWSKFHFVDLAGAERTKRTGATGSVLKEGININKGLLCLGNVISALTETGKKALHIPYRDSKLTRILQDSLGGNSKTCMIACVSPAEINFEETLNALKYANRARNIKNKPMVNRDPNSVMLAQLRQEVFELKAEVRNYQQLMSASGNPDMMEQLRLMKSSPMGSSGDNELKQKYAELEKRNKEVCGDLDVSRNRLTTVEIDLMKIKRERDIYKSKYEATVELLNKNGIEYVAEEEDNAPDSKLIDEYTHELEKLLKDNQEKDKLNRDLQMEYESLMKSSERDSKLLTKLSEELETCRREMARKMPLAPVRIEESLSENVATYGRMFVESIRSNFETLESLETEENEEVSSDGENITEEVTSDGESMPEPDLDTEKQELQIVDNSIKEKEEMLKSIEETFKEMQSQLLGQMQEQYTEKISCLQSEITKAERDREMAMTKVSKTSDKSAISESYKKKIQQLEVQLQNNKKNDREQVKLFRLVETQKTQITKLANEIKTAKTQKVQLTKKIKQEQDAFTRMKTERNRELIKVRRQALIKDQKIIKLENEGRKKEIFVRRKMEELNAYQKRAKNRPTKAHLEAEAIQKFVSEYTVACLKDEEVKIKLKKEIEEKNSIVEDINKIQKSIARATLRVEKLQLELEEENDFQILSDIEQDKEEIKELNETLEILEEKRKFKEQHIIKSQSNVINSEVQDMKAKYLNITNIQDAHTIASVLFDELLKHAEDHKKLKQLIAEKDLEIEEANSDAQKARARLLTAKVQMQTMEKEFEEKRQIMMQEQSPIVFVEEVESSNQKEERIEDLQKQLNRMSSKYTNLHKNYSNLVENVERPKEEKSRPKSQRFSHTSLRAARDKMKMDRSFDLAAVPSIPEVIEPTSAPPVRKSITLTRNRHSASFAGIPGKLDISSFLPSIEKWKCTKSFEAHSGPVYSMVANENVLFSSSSKTFKIWSLDNMSLISEVPAHNSFIKAMQIMPESSVIVTACDRTIGLWDTISLKNVGKLVGHKDEIRALHTHDNYLFSAGKGNSSAGSLIVWDIRQQLTPILEREKGCDLFSLFGFNNVLYYGGRSHKVGRLSIPDFETLPPFTPPHYDTVTAITAIQNTILSGSRDKNIKRWSLDSTEVNTGNIIGAHQDWVNALETDFEDTHTYSAGKDGKIRVWHVNDVLECVTELKEHTSSVNCLAKIQGGTKSFVSASSDKCIKLWQQQPSSS